MTKAVAAVKLWKRVFRGSLGLIFVVMPAGVFIGCGGSPSPTGPMPGQNTTVVLLLTSTANDQLSQFHISINNVQLVDKSGNPVALYDYNNQGQQPAEFMHLNGTSEPLAIATVPQGVYTSAIVVTNDCEFTAITFGPPSAGQPNSLITATYGEGLCGQGTGQTTVSLPSPITVSGTAVALSLNLQVSQSYTLAGVGANATYTISPVFSLTPSTISPAPTNDQNGKITGVDAQITSVDATGSDFGARTISGVPLTLNSDSNTAFQGISGIGSLSAGTLTNMDFAIQPDGSLLATRVEVDDPSAPAEFFGPWLSYTAVPGVFVVEPQACFVPDYPTCDSAIHTTNTTTFAISLQLTNLPNLPFAPTVSSSAFVLGAIFSTFPSASQDPQGTPYATTVTLKPQAINGTVTAMSAINGFSVYTVALAQYDLIPTLQQNLAPGSPNQLNAPSSVIVYADSNTQLLNSGTISQGSLLRFRGVIFYDNGTARMDCQEILDGVTE